MWRRRRPHSQALGRSRGGLSTKINMAVRGLGCPVRFTLTAGQKGDAPQADALIEGLPADIFMATPLMTVIACAMPSPIRRCGGDPKQSVPHAKTPAAQAPLCPAAPDRVLLRQTQAVPKGRHEKTARNYLADGRIAVTRNPKGRPDFQSECHRRCHSIFRVGITCGLQFWAAGRQSRQNGIPHEWKIEELRAFGENWLGNLDSNQD